MAATGWAAAQIERLAGRSWMALEAGDAALHAASRYLDPVDLHAREEELARERAQTIDQLHHLAEDLHTDTPLLHWLDLPTAARRLLGLPAEVRACVFDLDSVLTTSATIHAAAWADTFDSLLLGRAARLRQPFIPFDRDADYRTYLAERPRFEGIREFLASRQIRLPEGAPGDPADADTVHGLANRKGLALQRHLAQDGVAAYIGSRCYLEAANLVGIRTAVVSPSSNTDEILRRAGLARFIQERIDATVIESGGLRPKPAPDTLLAACRQLCIEPAQVADFETMPAGVEGARRAGMRFVVAVLREGSADPLHAVAPDVVVNDLAQLLDHREA
ncbi:MAG TPA: HAD family hydrolase [Gaiellales bacterium]|nr:HAD family hydrolase [Gaiellales bacterium]